MAEKAGDFPDRQAALAHLGGDGVADHMGRHLPDLGRSAAPFLDCRTGCCREQRTEIKGARFSRDRMNWRERSFRRPVTEIRDVEVLCPRRGPGEPVSGNHRQDHLRVGGGARALGPALGRDGGDGAAGRTEERRYGQANHLAAILFPPALRRLSIARDRDPAGKTATKTLADRAHRAGIDAIALTPHFADFNEDLRRRGIEELPTTLRIMLAPEDVVRFLL